MTETFICCHCGQEHPLENRVMVGDDAICERCANEETVICTHCGERIYRDDNAGDENMPLCQSCYDRHYTSCELFRSELGAFLNDMSVGALFGLFP